MKDQSNRTHLIKAYLNDSEYQRFRRIAATTNSTNSDLVRRLLQTSVFVEFPPVEYREIIDQLEHIGINLNQLAYKMAVGVIGCLRDAPEVFVLAIVKIGFDKVCSVALIFHFVFSFVAIK